MKKKNPKLTLAVVRKRLHKELCLIQELFGKHKADGHRWNYLEGGCTGCSGYIGRISVMKNAIKLAGGRVND